MRQPYSKIHLTIDEQITKLKNNGLVIDNEDYAKNCLMSYNYYRLSAYWHLFRQQDPANPYKKLGKFEPNHTFEEVDQLYEFDYQLRKLVFEAISDIETFLRTQLAYHIPSIKNDAFAMYDRSLFYMSDRRSLKGLNYPKLINDIFEETRRSSDEDFIKHFSATYTDYPKLPFWVLTEILSFGNLRKIYKHLKATHKPLISQSFNISTVSGSPLVLSEMGLDSCLFMINKYRNVCAHHGRLWNRKTKNVITANLATELQLTGHVDGGLYALIIIIARLLEPTGHAKDWKDSIYCLLTKGFPLGDVTTFTTLPINWYEHPVWR